MTPESRPATLDALDGLAGVDAMVCFVDADERPFSGALGLADWRLCGAVSRVVKSGFFSAQPSERLLMPTAGRLPVPRLFVVGLGPRALASPAAVEHQVSHAATMLVKAGVDAAALSFGRLAPEVARVRDEVLARSFAPRFPGRWLMFL